MCIEERCFAASSTNSSKATINAKHEDISGNNNEDDSETKTQRGKKKTQTNETNDQNSESLTMNAKQRRRKRKRLRKARHPTNETLMMRNSDESKMMNLKHETSEKSAPMRSPEPGHKRSHSPQVDADSLDTQETKRFEEYSRDCTRTHGDCTNKSSLTWRKGQSTDYPHKARHTQSVNSSTEHSVRNNEAQMSKQHPHSQEPSVIQEQNHSNNLKNQDYNPWQRPMESSTGEYIQNAGDEINELDQTLEHDKSNDTKSQCLLKSLKNPSTYHDDDFKWYLGKLTNFRNEMLQGPFIMSEVTNQIVTKLIHEVRNEQTSYVSELFDLHIMKCFREKLRVKVIETLMNTTIQSYYNAYTLYRSSYDVRSDCETFNTFCQNSRQNSQSLDYDKAAQQSQSGKKFQEIYFLGPKTATYSILRIVMMVSMQVIQQMVIAKTFKPLIGYTLLYLQWLVRERLFKILQGKPYSHYYKGEFLHKVYSQYYYILSDAVFVDQIYKIRSTDFPSIDRLITTVEDSLKLANPSHKRSIRQARIIIMEQILNKTYYEKFVIKFNYVIYKLLVEYRLCKIYEALTYRNKVEMLASKLYEEYGKRHSVQAEHRLIDQLIRGKTSFVEYLESCNEEVEELEGATKLEKDLTERIQNNMHEILDRKIDTIFEHLEHTLKIRNDIPTTKHIIVPSKSNESHLYAQSEEPANSNTNTGTVLIHTNVSNKFESTEEIDQHNCQNNFIIEKDNIENIQNGPNAKQSNKEDHSIRIVNAAGNTQYSNRVLKTKPNNSKSKITIGHGPIPLSDDDITVPKVLITTREDKQTENAVMEEPIPTKKEIHTETLNNDTTISQNSITLTTDLSPKDVVLIGNSEELRQPKAISMEANLATPEMLVDEILSNALFEEKVKNKVHEYVRASLPSIKDKLRSKTMDDGELLESLGLHPPGKPLFTCRPFLMKICGKPNLPELDEIQDVLEKFNPLSYKMYPHKPNIIFVEFTSENDAIELFRQPFILDGSVISIAQAPAPDFSYPRRNNAEVPIHEQANPGNCKGSLYNSNVRQPAANGEERSLEVQEQRKAPKDIEDFETTVSRIDNQLHDLFIALKKSEEH